MFMIRNDSAMSEVNFTLALNRAALMLGFTHFKAVPTEQEGCLKSLANTIHSHTTLVSG